MNKFTYEKTTGEILKQTIRFASTCKTFPVAIFIQKIIHRNAIFQIRNIHVVGDFPHNISERLLYYTNELYDYLRLLN